MATKQPVWRAMREGLGVASPMRSLAGERWVEIVETRSRRVANVYLDGGWELLHVGTVAFWRSGDNQGVTGIEYVLARTKDVPRMAIFRALQLAETTRDRERAEQRAAYPPPVREGSV